MEEPSAHHIPSFSFSVSCSLKGLPPQIICLHQSASCPPPLHHEPAPSWTSSVQYRHYRSSVLYVWTISTISYLRYARLYAGHPQWTSEHLQFCYLQPRLLSFKQCSSLQTRRHTRSLYCHVDFTFRSCCHARLRPLHSAGTFFFTFYCSLLSIVEPALEKWTNQIFFF